MLKKRHPNEMPYRTKTDAPEGLALWARRSTCAGACTHIAWHGVRTHARARIAARLTRRTTRRGSIHPCNGTCRGRGILLRSHSKDKLIGRHGSTVPGCRQHGAPNDQCQTLIGISSSDLVDLFPGVAI